MLNFIFQFRRSVQDCLKPEHDDHFLLRWLRGNEKKTKTLINYY